MFQVSANEAGTTVVHTRNEAEKLAAEIFELFNIVATVESLGKHACYPVSSIYDKKNICSDSTVVQLADGSVTDAYGISHDMKDGRCTECGEMEDYILHSAHDECARYVWID